MGCAAYARHPHFDECWCRKGHAGCVGTRTFCQAQSELSTWLLHAVLNSAAKQTPDVVPSPGSPRATYWTASMTSSRV